MKRGQESRGFNTGPVPGSQIDITIVYSSRYILVYFLLTLYEAQEGSQIESLQNYKTVAYTHKGCIVTSNDGTEIPGETFISSRTKNILMEGSFDVKNWQMKEELWKRDSHGRSLPYILDFNTYVTLGTTYMSRLSGWSGSPVTSLSFLTAGETIAFCHFRVPVPFADVPLFFAL